MSKDYAYYVRGQGDRKVQDKTGQETPPPIRYNTQKNTRENRAVGFELRLSEMHDSERYGLYEYTQARTHFFLEAEQQKPPEKEFPGEHMEHLYPLIHEKIVHPLGGIPVQWIGMLQVGELKGNKQYRDHDEIEKEHFF